MRAIVTGGAGFIGSHVAEALVARGDDVHVLDDLSTGRRENVPAGAELARLNPIDSRATICFALHGDDLRYAGTQLPQLPAHRYF